MNKLSKIKSLVLSGMMAAASVAGSFSAAAPSLNAAAATDDYAKLLQYSLYFYDANMCGDQVGEHAALSWRDDCHTSDEVKGGYHDAGDHAMFGLPQGFTASMLGWSFYEFKDAYNATGQAEHLKVVSDHFNDFFKASTKLSGDSVSSFLYQKEDGYVDHAYWGTPENQESKQGKRKMYWTSAGASDIAADYAASLALSYINFGDEEDLKYAKALYKFSTQYNVVASDGPTGFYSSSGCTDEQANAAGWLYIATNDESYKNDCASKQTQYLGWADSWDNRGLGAACVYAHITGNWNKVNSYIQSEINSKTPNGYTFFDKWGSARLNASLQYTALVASKNSSADFTTWAKGQMDYLTGSNPANTCFIVGFADNSAKNPHHRAASGFNSYEDFNGENHPQSVGANSKLLVGALVGGPTDANGSYVDDMNDYVCNEVAIDYNAGLVGAAAGLYELTGSKSTIVTSIPGVTKIYNGEAGGGTVIEPTPNPNPSGSSGKYEITPNKTIDYSQLPADDKMIGFKWEDLGVSFDETVESVEVNISATGNIGKWEGAFGSTTNQSPDYWTQSTDMSQTISGSKGIITWKPSASQAAIFNTTDGELKFGVWWIDCGTFTIDSIVVKTDKYDPNASQTVVTSAVTTKKDTPTTTKAVATTPSQGNDVTLLPADMSVGTEKGDDGETNNYAEFSPNGAKSATLYLKVNSTDNNVSGAFGTWTGSAWEQVDFENVSVPASKVVEIEYEIPSNVGSTVKAMVFWPHGDGVTIEKIVLHKEGTSTPPTTDAPTTAAPSTNLLYGDANCDGIVDIADATLILQYLGNGDKYKISTQGLKNADVCAPTGITAADSLTVQQLDAGLIKASDLPLK
ncbi:MAG: glycoside hydrolase family 9 protein [Alistipes sp.]|nr:glycoside hydrolase family 9 protein [Alistipes sp.]